MHGEHSPGGPWFLPNHVTALLPPVCRQRLSHSAQLALRHGDVLSSHLLGFLLPAYWLLGRNKYFGFLPSPLCSRAPLSLPLAHGGYKQKTGYGRPPHLPPSPATPTAPAHHCAHCAPGHPADNPICSLLHVHTAPNPSFQSFPRSGKNLASPVRGTSENSRSTHLGCSQGPVLSSLMEAELPLLGTFCTRTHTHPLHHPHRRQDFTRISTMDESPRPPMEVAEDDADGFPTVRERAWHTGSWEPCRKDDLAVSLDPELAPVVCASGKYLCHEDKATHANCCLLSDPHSIYSVSPVKQMFQPYICKPFWHVSSFLFGLSPHHRKSPLGYF